MINWINEKNIAQLNADQTLSYWLTEPQCLTETLEAHSPSLSVRLLSMDFNIPQSDELVYLEPHHQSDRFIVREIYLEDKEVQWTYARVIVPEETYQENERDFDTLGEQPIGKTLLFNRDHVTRSSFECGLLRPHTWLSNPHITNVMEQQLGPRTLGMRRSLFFINQKPLLISELYFPVVLDLPIDPDTNFYQAQTHDKIPTI
jgi:chorismate--pyruvate lyase